MSHATLGHPRQTGPSGEFWQNVVHWAGNGKPRRHSCLQNPVNSMKRQKDMILKDEPLRLEGATYATGEEKRKCSKRNEEAESKWKQCPVVDVSGAERKVWCCIEQYCTGIWNVRSMNQSKLQAVKQEMARVDINILGLCSGSWHYTGSSDKTISKKNKCKMAKWLPEEALQITKERKEA